MSSEIDRLMSQGVEKAIANLGLSRGPHDETARKRVPLEVVEEIAELAPLEDMIGLVTMFPAFRHSRVRERRFDIKRYLSRLFPDPDKFIQIMLLTNSCVSGSRALEFFLPGMAEKESDWDIYCCGDNVSLTVLLGWMVDNGLKLDRPQADRQEYYGHACVSVLNGVVGEGSEAKKVQVIASDNQDPVTAVLNFHSSIVQCFISGWGAVSVMSELTRKRQSVRWSGCGSNAEAMDRAISKYKSRGVEYVEMIGYTSETEEIPLVGLSNCRHFAVKLRRADFSSPVWYNIADMMKDQSYKRRWRWKDGKLRQTNDRVCPGYMQKCYYDTMDKAITSRGSLLPRAHNVLLKLGVEIKHRSIPGPTGADGRIEGFIGRPGCGFIPIPTEEEYETLAHIEF